VNVFSFNLYIYIYIIFNNHAMGGLYYFKVSNWPLPQSSTSQPRVEQCNSVSL